jgi:histidinol-phosphate aminotransferase
MSLLDTFRADVRAMHAYHVQDAAGYIKLDAMENPFTLPSPRCRMSWASVWVRSR